MREREIKCRIQRAEELLDELFADGAEAIGFMPLKDVHLSMIRDAINAVTHGYMRKVTYEIPRVCKAEVSMNSKGIIEIKRTEGRTVTRKES
ncbi:MAG: hypothetical protein GX942_00455 [Papillibacter sp.]|nr:hypothetical protein [Papillibacter sp.]